MNLKNINNLVQLFFEKYKQLKNKNTLFLSSLKEPKKTYTWEQTFNFINIVSQELKKIVNKGDRCLLISENRPEWFISDLSIMFSEAITVPAYTTYAEKDYEYIINDCKPSVIFVSNDEQFNKIKKIISEKSYIKQIFSFENLNDTDENNFININDLLQTNLQNELNNFNIKRNDIACIIYTSGTQGNPKGVMLSHGGILNNCEGAIRTFETIN